MGFDLSVYEMMMPLCYGGSVVLGENALEAGTMMGREDVGNKHGAATMRGLMEVGGST